MRFEQFSLEPHGEKTRLLEFGRYAIERRPAQASCEFTDAARDHYDPDFGAWSGDSNCAP